MFDKILVPLDGSVEAESVLPYLRDLASRFGSQVYILGVGAGNKRRRVNRFLEEYAGEVASDLHAWDIKAEAAILYGSPADRMLDYAEGNEIDLIIMATHGRGGITRWWMGSVAEKIVSETVVPVLLVQSKHPEKAEAGKKLSFVKVLVPLDGSDIGESALSNIEILAVETGVSVNLLRVITPPGVVEANVFGPDLKKFVGAMQDTCKDYLSSVVARLSEKGVKATYDIITGDPADKIVEYARNEGVDLIAMSTHGRSGIARWVLGSVADKVLHAAKMPMLLVRSPRMAHPRP